MLRRHLRVWWWCPRFMCLVFWCPGLICQRKFGTTGNTVCTVAKSAGSTARMNGSAVAGGGSAIIAISAISGSGTEQLRSGAYLAVELSGRSGQASAGFARVFLFVKR
jgi:hypothetical protein